MSDERGWPTPEREVINPLLVDSSALTYLAKLVARDMDTVFHEPSESAEQRYHYRLHLYRKLLHAALAMPPPRLPHDQAD
jgi:hypothetical protein